MVPEGTGKGTEGRHRGEVTHAGRVDYERAGSDYLQKRQLKRGAAGWILLGGPRRRLRDLRRFRRLELRARARRLGRSDDRLAADGARCTPAWCFALAELATTMPVGRRRLRFRPARVRSARAGSSPAPRSSSSMPSRRRPSPCSSAGTSKSLGLFGTDQRVAGLPRLLRCSSSASTSTASARRCRSSSPSPRSPCVAYRVRRVDVADGSPSTTWFDIAPTDAVGASAVPARSAMAGILGGPGPFAIWFFLAIEGVPLAAEETRDPKRDMPRGIIGGDVRAAGVLRADDVLRPGRRGLGCASQDSDNPLPLAVRTRPSAGRRGSPSSSTSSAWPAWLPASSPSSTPTRGWCSPCPAPAICRAACRSPDARKSPWVALIVPGIIGFLLPSLTEHGALADPHGRVRRDDLLHPDDGRRTSSSGCANRTCRGRTPRPAASSRRGSRWCSRASAVVAVVPRRQGVNRRRSPRRRCRPSPTRLAYFGSTAATTSWRRAGEEFAAIERGRGAHLSEDHPMLLFSTTAGGHCYYVPKACGQ